MVYHHYTTENYISLDVSPKADLKNIIRPIPLGCIFLHLLLLYLVCYVLEQGISSKVWPWGERNVCFEQVRAWCFFSTRVKLSLFSWSSSMLDLSTRNWLAAVWCVKPKATHYTADSINSLNASERMHKLYIRSCLYCMEEINKSRSWLHSESSEVI